MPKNSPENTQSRQSEEIVRAYFEVRPGWSITKLDAGKNQAIRKQACPSLAIS